MGGKLPPHKSHGATSLILYGREQSADIYQ